MAIKEGDKAPSFKAKNQNDQSIALKDLKGKKVVLYFYPKDMTPGCTQESCDFRDSFSAIKKAGAVVLGVSLDSSERHRKFIEKEKLNFDLIADEDKEVSNAYGVYQQKSLYGRKFMGIVRTTFIIDESGKIKKIFPKVKVKDHVKEVLACLKEK